MGDSGPVDYLFLTVGSRGDVQPFVNLAQELAFNRGKTVVIAAHSEYQQLVEGAAAIDGGNGSGGCVPVTTADGKC